MTNSSPVEGAKAEAVAVLDGGEPAEKPLIQLEGFLPHRLNVLSSLVSQALTQVYANTVSAYPNGGSWSAWASSAK